MYALADYNHISVHPSVFITMAAHFAGLLASSFFIKNIRVAKKLMLFTIVFCIAASVVFFLKPSWLWTAMLSLSAFLVGCCVAAWGFYFKSCTPKDERMKTMADGLIGSNILMILLNMAAIHISSYAGLTFSMLMLGMAFLFALRLPQEELPTGVLLSGQKNTSLNNTGPLAFLCLFIIVITVNSGLMYQVQCPAFSHLEWLTSWYWALPYIVALLLMRNLPRKTNRAYTLYVAIAMIGFSFITFLILDRSWLSYLVVNTLMMGACGMFDLFWWSILGEMLELDHNPAKVMGIGLSANVLGVLLGGLIGNTIIISALGQIQTPTLLALGVVCITLVLLPPLHQRLIALLKNHAYLTVITEMQAQEQNQIIQDFSAIEKLTGRESEIAALLIQGKTYRMIAAELHVSENTIKTHIKNIYTKVGVQSRTELMNLLMEMRQFPVKS